MNATRGPMAARRREPVDGRAAAVAAFLILLSVLVAMGLRLFAPGGGRVAVLFPSAEAAVAVTAAAGAAILDSRLGGHLVVAVPEGDGFAASVRAAGAALVLPLALPLGCSAAAPKH